MRFVGKKTSWTKTFVNLKSFPKIPVAYTPSAKKKAGIGYEDIVREVQAGTFKPIYYLCGEESYYIDRLADFIADKAVAPEDRDFNLTVLYGADITVDTIIAAARRRSMLGGRQAIVVKEAQNVKNLDRLELYLKQPLDTTVLVVCHKNGTIDRRTKLATLVAKEGVLFESKKMYENQLPTFIRTYAVRHKADIEPRAAEILADHIGNDLNRLATELDKLFIALPQGQKLITADLVMRSTGITKDFSIFDLQDAIVKKDVFKANRIAKYFAANQKTYPLQMVLPVLFKFFSNLMLAFYAPQKSESGLAEWLGVSPWTVRNNYLPGLRAFTGVKVMQIIGELRRVDARSKGVGGAAPDGGALLKELLFFILH